MYESIQGKIFLRVYMYIYVNIYLYIISVFIFSCIQDIDQFYYSNFRSLTLSMVFTAMNLWQQVSVFEITFPTEQWSGLFTGQFSCQAAKLRVGVPCHLPTWWLVSRASPYLVALSIHLSLEVLELPWDPLCTFLGVLFLQVARASLDPLQNRAQNTIRCQTQGLSIAIPVILL